MVMISSKVKKKWEGYKAKGIPEITLRELFKNQEMWASAEEEKLMTVKDIRIHSKFTEQKDYAMTNVFSYGTHDTPATNSIQVLFPLFDPFYGPIGNRALEQLGREYEFRNKLILLAALHLTVTPYLKAYDFDFVGDEDVEGMAACFKGLYRGD